MGLPPARSWSLAKSEGLSAIALSTTRFFFYCQADNLAYSLVKVRVVL
ncbi:MAG: hypothetical protein PUP90_13795 [Nostoc sp. S4]|nr:hypothetical protein [Nostoc sp. S4]